MVGIVGSLYIRLERVRSRFALHGQCHEITRTQCLELSAVHVQAYIGVTGQQYQPEHRL